MRSGRRLAVNQLGVNNQENETTQRDNQVTLEDVIRGKDTVIGWLKTEILQLKENLEDCNFWRNLRSFTPRSVRSAVNFSREMRSGRRPSVNQLSVINCLGSSCSSPASPSCSGSIKLHTSTTVHTLLSSDIIDFVNHRFGEISSISVDGNCCWRVATRRNGRGTTRDFTQAVTRTNHQVDKS